MNTLASTVKGSSGACCRICEKHLPKGRQCIRSKGNKEVHVICKGCIYKAYHNLRAQEPKTI